MQMFFVVVLAILTVISWYGFIRCMVNPNWLRQKGEEAHGRRYYAIKPPAARAHRDSSLNLRGADDLALSEPDSRLIEP